MSVGCYLAGNDVAIFAKFVMQRYNILSKVVLL